jgi:pyruvate dehydrogenase E2 component (dihydrolipoamide acetyltransferase)
MNMQAQRIIASPLAKRVAAQMGVNLSGIAGTGPRGRIIRLDVENAAKSGANKPIANNKSLVAATTPQSGYTLEPHSMMRKVIAKRLSESKQTVPHFYLTVDCKLDGLLEMRARLNKKLESDGVKLSVNDLIIKAVASALVKIPNANVSWSDEGLLKYHQADISVAVAIPGGLITPIIRNAERKGFKEISLEMKALAERAKAGKLQPEEYTGGSFSISNLGMYGIRDFAAIINPPQAAILAVGQGDQRAIVADGEVQIANIMTCTLSVDHRAIDGAVGAEFIQAFKGFIEEPFLMMV